MMQNRVNKVLLISPAHDKIRARREGKVAWYSRVFRYSQQLGLLYVASSFPQDIDVRIIDESVEPIDFNAAVDLVGISCMTVQTTRAYDIADQFRAEGLKVILGGFHPTFMPEEAIKHADAVCVGEAENIIPVMIEDYLAGKMNGIYRGELVDLRKLPVPDRTKIKGYAYFTDSILTTRGCEHECHYCSESLFFRHKQRIRPLDSIVNEMHNLGKNLLFLDSNIIANRPFAVQLFNVMKQLGKRWASQCSIEIANDTGLLELAAKSGCMGIFIGFESLSQKNLYAFNKEFNVPSRFDEMIKKIHGYGIGILASFMFGMDDDNEGVFDETLEFLDRNRIEALNALIMTPCPGTRLYEQMDRQGRITNKNWHEYDFHHVIFKPICMEPEELQAGADRVLREFYSTSRVIKRIMNASHLSLESVMKSVLPVNLTYWHNLLRDIG